MSYASDSTDVQPVRVVLVISNLEYGGAQRQAVELANNLAPERFDVHVCSLSKYVPLAKGLDDHERRLHVVEKKFMFDATVVPRLAWLLRRLRGDVVHGFLFDAEIAARLAGRLARTRVIIGSERNTDYRLKLRQLVSYRLTRRCVDLTIANSRAGAAFNGRMLGHDPSHYRVIHNGVDTDRFRPQDRIAVRRELGIADARPVVGLFGSFKAQKNHPLFFAAAKPILDRFPDTVFLLVGDELFGGMHGSDEYRRRMEELVNDLGIRPHCRFLGNRDDVEALYCACDLTILPSLFEGTPNVALESMACGVPVVATDVSDNAYVVPDGKVGYIVPLGDERALAARVSQLLEDRQLREQMGQAAREWVEREFSTKRLAEKTAEVYMEALFADRREQLTPQ